MSGIDLQQLKAWAGQPNVELYVEGGKRHGSISERTGSFGGRTIRSLTVDPRGPEAMEYEQAKHQVREALCNIYGEELGDQAFRAGIGSVNERNQHIWETNQPLTGRDIAKMIAYGEQKARTEGIEMELKTGALDDSGLGPTSDEDRHALNEQIESGPRPGETETTNKTIEQRKLEETQRKYPLAKHIEISHEEFYADPTKYVNENQTVEVRVQPAERAPIKEPGSHFPSEETITREMDTAIGNPRTDYHSQHRISVSEDSVDVGFSTNIPFEYLRVRHYDKEITFRPPAESR